MNIWIISLWAAPSFGNAPIDDKKYLYEYGSFHSEPLLPLTTPNIFRRREACGYFEWIDYVVDVDHRIPCHINILSQFMP
jgi:hypothetical protein